MENIKTHFSRPENTDHYWDHFRQHIIGKDLEFENEHGKHKVLYADWIASGRLYRPIEEALSNQVGVLVANPHSYSSYTGAQITALYKSARLLIKRHVNANEDDVLVTLGSGMTDALIRLQHILNLKERSLKVSTRPVVFITHMEHHSNHVSWIECGADVVVVPSDADNLVEPANLRYELQKYRDRNLKIGAFSACSNVTGVINPIHELAEIMHEEGGLCFADYAASAPYVSIDMHPENEAQHLDAIYFSPHKFLGGPGSCGILIFNKSLHSGVPSIPGGGNVKWTDPWGGYGYTQDVESQEDGGTPAFMQTIKAAMAIRLKEKMGVCNIQSRENNLMSQAICTLNRIPKVVVIETPEKTDKIGCISFNIKGLHYNLVVRLLNDRFGIQTRGGWSCAGTYAHYIFNIIPSESKEMTGKLEALDASIKPGWIRLSLHPTMTDEELNYCLTAIEEVAVNGVQWQEDFCYNPITNEFEKACSDNHHNSTEDLVYEFDMK